MADSQIFPLVALALAAAPAALAIGVGVALHFRDNGLRRHARRHHQLFGNPGIEPEGFHNTTPGHRL